MKRPPLATTIVIRPNERLMPIIFLILLSRFAASSQSEIATANFNRLNEAKNK